MNFLTYIPQNLHVAVVDMDLEDSPGCTYDYVEILEVTNMAPTLSRIRLCGIYKNFKTNIEGRIIHIHFKSDPIVSEKGFKLSIRTDENKSNNSHGNSTEMPKVASTTSSSSSKPANSFQTHSTTSMFETI